MPPDFSFLSGHPRGELGLFLRRWLANPLSMGAVAPSAPALSRRMARETLCREGAAVVELGPGTGAVTRALLDAGVPPDRLFPIERDAALHAHLVRRFPQVDVILGDAADLETLLPACWHGRVSTVVSSLPLVSLPADIRNAVGRSAFRVLAGDGRMVQFTYGLFSPLPRRELGIDGRKVAFAGANLPPAFVWRYERSPQPDA